MMWRRMVLLAGVMIGAACFGPMMQSAQACPMCKIANEQDALLPTAYMYSILFMMGMIFSLAGGVGLAVFFISRRENAALAAMGQLGEDHGEYGSLNLLADGAQPATA